jgi:metal transporter CNNM
MDNVPPLYTGWVWYGMLILVIALFIIYGLLAGLTLAICSLELQWLQMKCNAGTAKQRQQARAVSQMVPRFRTWMLCSMIICGIAAGGFIPFIIQGLWHWHSQWVPILTSTLVLALCAEILPQYFIPQHPLAWGWACCPLIWICMLLTATVSCPLALLLDYFGKGDNDKDKLFTNAEVAALIEFQAERRAISKDASKIMLAALNFDTQSLCGRFTATTVSKKDEDVELASIASSPRIITPWITVQTVDIDELVDNEFLTNVKNCKYSRIPVIDGTEIFGFLEVKVRLNCNKKRKDTICMSQLLADT